MFFLGDKLVAGPRRPIWYLGTWSFLRSLLVEDVDFPCPPPANFHQSVSPTLPCLRPNSEEIFLPDEECREVCPVRQASEVTEDSRPNRQISQIPPPRPFLPRPRWARSRRQP